MISALRASALASAPPDDQQARSSNDSSSRVVTATAGPAAPAPNPHIGWDLTLYPKRLNDAYWRERALKHSHWDFQVVLFLSATLLALTLRFYQQMGLTRVTVSFGLAWLMCLTWAAALHFPTYYLPNRIQIVLVGRALMALSAYLATNGVQEQLYKTLMFPAAKLSLFLKMFLFCNTGQMPVESLRLQLPLLWQLAGTAGKAVALFLSEFTTEFVVFCDSPRYLTALSEMNTFWSTLVQSGSPLPLPISSLLAGHSSGAVMAVTTLWMTLVSLIGYLCYMSLWSDMRAWLASKGRAAAAQGAETVDIAGVALTLEQLRRMCNTPFTLLLQSTGIAGTLAKVLMHLGLVNFVCILAWVVSHLLVQQFLPGALPQSLLGTYYSPLPQQQAQDVSSAVLLG